MMVTERKEGRGGREEGEEEGGVGREKEREEGEKGARNGEWGAG